MKKLAAGLLAVCMLVLLVISLNGGFDDVEDKNIRFNEAAFTIPSSVSGAADATGFLVGEFDGDDGSHISVDGKGNIKFTPSEGLVRSGKYTLLQQKDLSVMIRLSFDNEELHYIFKLVSESGEFSLTDANGNAVIYKPVII